MTLLSPAQDAAYTTVSFISGFLSMCGSLLMIRLASRRLRGLPGCDASLNTNNNNRRGNGNSSNLYYHFLMVAIGVSDVSTMLGGAMLGTFLYPSDAPNAPSFAVGNAATCSVSAYMSSIWFLAGTMCNFSLAWYFFLTVQKGWRHRSDFTSVRRVWWLVIVILPQTIAICAFASDSYHPLYFTTFCWLTDYNILCPSGVCRRGRITSNILTYGLLLAIAVGSIASMVLTVRVWRSYRNIVHRLRQYNFVRQSQSTMTSHRPPSSSLSATERQVITSTSTRTRHDDYLKQATSQACWYCVVYVNQFIWLVFFFVLGRIVNEDNVGALFPWMILAVAIYPLNGVLNTFVYIRPAYGKVRRAVQEVTRCQALYYILLDKTLQDIRETAPLQRKCSNRFSRATSTDVTPRKDGSFLLQPPPNGANSRPTNNNKTGMNADPTNVASVPVVMAEGPNLTDDNPLIEPHHHHHHQSETNDLDEESGTGHPAVGVTMVVEDLNIDGEEEKGSHVDIEQRQQCSDSNEDCKVQDSQ